MEKHILTCEVCQKQAVAEGTCPNELMKSSGYILGDNEYWDCWFCSEECKNYDKRMEILGSLN